MKSQDRSVAVFRDFEKMFKLVSLYRGERHQLMPHVKMTGTSLANSLEDEDFTEGVLQFDFLMTAVYSDGVEVFRSERPEQTMSYALFCEGVKSIVVARGFDGGELLEWCSMLREALKPGRTEVADLASILWRNKYQHLRVLIYNALLEVDDIGDDYLSPGEENDILAVESSADTLIEKGALQGDFGKKRFGRGSLGMGEAGATRSAALLRIRDQFWSLPSTQRYGRAFQPLNDKEVEKLRGQLSDAAYSDRARNVLRFSAAEIAPLRTEMESYDANHIEFNLLTRIFSMLEANLNLDPKVIEFSQSQLQALIKSIISRFHAGLVLYLLKRLNAVKDLPHLKAFVQNVVQQIRDALALEENRKLLLEALDSKEGRKPALELLSFISKEEWIKLLDILILRNHQEPTLVFLEFIKSKESNFAQTLLGLGATRLSHLIKVLVQMDWSEKDNFLGRCLTSKSPDLVEKTLPFIGRLKVPVDLAIQTFSKLGKNLQRDWIEILIEGSELEQWRDFVRSLLVKEVWRQCDDDTAVLILKLALKYLKNQAIQPLQPYIEGRRWKLWPAYPHERDLILSSLITNRDKGIQQLRLEIIERESQTWFQSRDLKERLRGAL